MGVNASIEGSNPSFSASGTERCPSGLRSATGNRVRAERCVAGSNPALSALARGKPCFPREPLLALDEAVGCSAPARARSRLRARRVLAQVGDGIGPHFTASTVWDMSWGQTRRHGWTRQSAETARGRFDDTRVSCDPSVSLKSAFRKLRGTPVVPLRASRLCPRTQRGRDKSLRRRLRSSAPPPLARDCREARRARVRV
jgi:hypothetical protein